MTDTTKTIILGCLGERKAQIRARLERVDSTESDDIEGKAQYRQHALDALAMLDAAQQEVREL